MYVVPSFSLLSLFSALCSLGEDICKPQKEYRVLYNLDNRVLSGKEVRVFVGAINISTHLIVKAMAILEVQNIFRFGSHMKLKDLEPFVG